MANSKSPSIGPMSVQPVEHSSSARNQLPAMMSTRRRRKEDAPAEKPTSQDGGGPRRESKNYAAQFSAEAATSPKALILVSHVPFLELIARSSSRRYDSPCTVKRCSSFSPPMYNSIRCLKAVHGPPWSRNGLQEYRTGSARDQRGEYSWDELMGSFQSLNR